MGFFDFLKGKKQRSLEAAMADVDKFLAGTRPKTTLEDKITINAAPSPRTPLHLPQKSGWDAMLETVQAYSKITTTQVYVGTHDRELRQFRDWHFSNHVTRNEQEKALAECIDAFGKLVKSSYTPRLWSTASKVVSTYLMLLTEDMSTNLEVERNSYMACEVVRNALRLRQMATRAREFYNAIAMKSKDNPFEENVRRAYESSTKEADTAFERRREYVDRALKSELDHIKFTIFPMLERESSSYDRRQTADIIIRNSIDGVRNICRAYGVPEPAELDVYARRIEPCPREK